MTSPLSPHTRGHPPCPHSTPLGRRLDYCRFLGPSLSRSHRPRSRTTRDARSLVPHPPTWRFGKVLGPRPTTGRSGRCLLESETSPRMVQDLRRTTPSPPILGRFSCAPVSRPETENPVAIVRRTVPVLLSVDLPLQPNWMDGRTRVSPVPELRGERQVSPRTDFPTSYRPSSTRLVRRGRRSVSAVPSPVRDHTL